MKGRSFGSAPRIGVALLVPVLFLLHVSALLSCAPRLPYEVAPQQRSLAIVLPRTPSPSPSLHPTGAMDPPTEQPPAQLEEPGFSCKDAVADSGTVNVVVPLRNRENHLKSFLRNMTRQLRHQRYAITVVNDTGKRPFNRGALLNVGFIVGETKSTWTVLHDVDMLPPPELCYTEPPNNTLVAMKCGWYQLYVGGVAAIRNSDFRRIDGFSNRFQGWGSEDDFLYSRGIEMHRLRFHRVPPPLCDEYHHMETGHRREVGQFRNPLSTASRDAEMAREWFAGDGISRFSRPPALEWSVADGPLPHVTVVTVNMDSFVPCMNGEVMPFLRPCLAAPVTEHDALRQPASEPPLDAFIPDPEMPHMDHMDAKEPEQWFEAMRQLDEEVNMRRERRRGLLKLLRSQNRTATANQ